MIGSHIVHHSLSASHETFILDRNNSLSQRLGTTDPCLQQRQKVLVPHIWDRKVVEVE